MKSNHTAIRLVLGTFAGLVLASAANAASVTVTVAGSSNPFLAAQPPGTSCCGGDSAPAQSPVLATTDLVGGTTLTFSALGGVSYNGGAPASGADGDNDGTNYTYRFDMPSDNATGVSGPVQVNVDGLVGVFTSGTPSGPAPAQLDFSASSSSTGLDFTSLAPAVDQIFWIGDGLTGIGTGTVQDFIVPEGATALYLGTVDGSGWYNNTGEIIATVNGLPSVSAAPEPSTWALMIAGVGLIGGMLRVDRRRGTLAAV